VEWKKYWSDPTVKKKVTTHKECQSEKPSLRRLMKNYALPLWKGLTLLAFVSIVATLLTAMQPIILSGLLEVVLGSDSSVATSSGNANTQSLSFFNLNTIGEKINLTLVGENTSLENSKFKPVLLMLSFFLILAFFSSLFNFAAQSISSWLKASSTSLIRADFSKHLLSLDLSFFHNQKSGELISRFTQDATNTAIGIGPLLHGFIHHGLLIIIYSVYLISTDYLLAFGVILIGVLQWTVTRFVKGPIQLSQKNQLDKIASITSTLQETLTSIRVIKSFGADKYELKKFSRGIKESKKSDFKAGTIRALDPNLRSFLDNFAIVGIFALGAFQLQNDKLTLEGFLLFLFVGRLLVTPINKFSVNFSWMHALLASYERLFEIFQVEKETKDGNVKIDTFDKSIVVKNINFSYENIKILDNISFELHKGEILALVGPSGSGKSTLIDLILRLYDPSSGSVDIDNINLKTFKVNNYRQLFGVVPQESLLFNDTILNNICFGRDVWNKQQAEKVAKIANAHDFIMRLPNGYDTLAGDRGVKLSGGQRQRISIARAIYSNPEIIIFDEATSSLDSESEKQVHDAMDDVLVNSTAIIIAHRLSTILHADKIIVLNGGKIEAIGRHKDLLGESSTYRQLYNLQFNKDNKTLSHV
jgi:ATP-binding cassette, subfamily B, bacterial MsbA